MDQGWKESLLLVANLPDGGLQVVPETVEKLCRIVDPVRCISFNGPYRTGKSHLLNVIISILFNRDNVFPVGNSIQAKTKGMWIWAGRHPQATDSSWILFMDTEGLHDVQKGDNFNDLQSFIVSLLLSSTFVYNSLGTIDYQALEKLHYVSTLAEKIRLRSDSAEDDEEEELGHDLIFPSFVWVVRDFHLRKSVDGKELTDDGYLENALRTRHDASNASQLSVKRCLKEYFPSRRCFTPPRLVAVEKGRQIDVDPRTLLRGLTDYILTSPLKIYEGSKITGKVLGRLAETYVPAVLTMDSVSQPRICIQDIMARINDNENSKVLASCFDNYKASLNRDAAEVLDNIALYSIHLGLLNQANMSYMASAVEPIYSHFPQLTEKINKEFEELCKRKSVEFMTSSADLWQTAMAEVIGDTAQYVINVGGYKIFQERVQRLKNRCKEERVFQSTEGQCFLATKLVELEEKEGKLIMHADRAMSDLQRTEEGKRQEAERKLEEAKVTAAAKVEADELANTSKELGERASSTMKKSLDEKKETEKAILKERIRTMKREKEELKGSGLEEEVDNRSERIYKYEEMVTVKEEEAQSIWSKIGTAAGELVSSAANTVFSRLQVPSAVQRLWSMLP